MNDVANDDNDIIWFTYREMKADQFIRDVFENKHDHFDLLWQRLDLIKPEPAWKRKRQPVQVYMMNDE